MVKQDQLIIYLDAKEPTQSTWSTGSYYHQGEIETLETAAKDREVIVIVPAEEILLRSVTLPKMNKARLQQALPYALEEQLVGEIDELHFAVSDYQADGSLPVAIVSKKKMREWRELLHSWKVQPDKLIPLSLALPNGTNQWQVLVSNSSAVRMNGFQGFAIENDNLKDFLTIALKEATNKPEKIHFYNATSHAYAPSFNDKMIVQEDFLSREQLIEKMTQLIDPANSINLLQAEFASKKPAFPKLQVKWKVAVYLAAIWLGLMVLYPIISYTLLKIKLVSVNHQITEIYQRHFPKATNAAVSKARLQEKLEAMMAQLGQNRLLLLLGYVGKGIKETPGVKVKHFDFHNDQLTLDISAASSEDLSALTDYLTQQGLSVKEQSTDVVGARLQAVMVVE